MKRDTRFTLFRQCSFHESASTGNVATQIEKIGTPNIELVALAGAPPHGVTHVLRAPGMLFPPSRINPSPAFERVSERLETYRARYTGAGARLKALLTMRVPRSESIGRRPVAGNADASRPSEPAEPAECQPLDVADAAEPPRRTGVDSARMTAQRRQDAERSGNRSAGESAPSSAPGAPVLRRYVGAALLAGCALLLSLFTFEYQYVGELSGLASSGRQPNVFAGMVRPSTDVTIAARAAVRIEQVLVEPGQHVRAGDPLFVVDDHEAREALPAARLEIEDAALEVQTLELQLGAPDRQLHELSRRYTDVTGELEVAARRTAAIPTPQIRSSTPRAQAAFDLAAMKLQRARQLHAQGIIAKQEVDEAEIALRVAEDDLELSQRADRAFAEAADVEASRARLRGELASAQEERERRQRSSALARARIRHERAVAAAKAFEQRIESSRIEAPVAGSIAEVRVSRGEVVPPGAVLARIADLAHLIVELGVPSEHIPPLRIGGPADIVISAATPVSARGVIRSIEPTPGANGTHRVVVEFPAPDDLILSGQAANVSFPGGSGTSVRSSF
jgi:membrane fusion protein, multidrug efflux system